MTISQAATAHPFLVEPAGGEVVMQGPLGVVTKIPGPATNGVMSIVEHPIAARLLVPPHVHQDHDEWSYILEGRIGARVGDDEFIAEAGSYILKPRKIPHVFWNPDDQPARIGDTLEFLDEVSGKLSISVAYEPDVVDIL